MTLESAKKHGLKPVKFIVWVGKVKIFYLQHPKLFPILVLLTFFLIISFPITIYEWGEFDEEPEVIDLDTTEKVPSFASDEKLEPLEPIDELETVKDISADKIISTVNFTYNEFMNSHEVHLPNDAVQRLHKFALSFDTISRLRYNRGVEKIVSQKEIDELITSMQDTSWYLEYILRITSSNIYSYSEDRALRILLSMHTSAYYYQIPYPTLFCLLFQESKFDFKVFSQTGAKGLGQLTSIALEQLEIVRKNPEEEARIQTAISALNQIYKDEVTLTVMKGMGFDPHFPKLAKLPKRITTPDVNSAFLQEVGKELVKMGYSYGENPSLVRMLSKQVSRGEVLPERYAAVHHAYIRWTERKFEQNLGNALNIETNLLLSAMLLRYYMDYRWKTDVEDEEVDLKPSLRVVFAIIAYNNGQRGLNSFLRMMIKENSKKELDEMTLNDFQNLFSRKKVADALQVSPRKLHEIFAHVKIIMNCSQKEPLFK